MSVAFCIQHAMRKHRIILSSVACPAVQYFSTLSHNETILKKILNVQCVFWFSPQFVSEIFLILRRTDQDFIKNICWSLCKVPVILTRFWWNWNLFDGCLKNSNIKFHQNPSSRSREAPSGRRDGLVDRQKNGQTWRN
jgi:hypothetical protein